MAKTKNMTAGPIAKTVLMFTVPYILITLFQQLYGAVDAAMVSGMISTNALAAVGSAGALSAITIEPIYGFANGFSVITAQRFGNGDDEGVKKSFAMSILITLVIAVVGTVFFVAYARSFLEFLKTPSEIIDDAHKYAFWIMLGCSGACLYNLLASMMRALGDSKTPLIFLIISSIIHIGLNFYLITFTNMGVRAAGVSTFISQLISGILCIVYIVKKFPLLHIKLKDFAPDVKMIAQLLKMGLPLAFLTLVVRSGGVMMHYTSNDLGTVYVAALSGATRAEGFITAPIVAFGHALAVFVAQNYGAQKYDRVKKSVFQGNLMTIAWSVVCTVLVVFAGKPLMRIIAGNDPDVILNGYYYLLIMSAGSVMLGPVGNFKYSLQACGRTLVTVASGFIETFCKGFVSVYMATALGFFGVCLAAPVSWFVIFIPIAIDYFYMLYKFKKTQAVLS